MLLALKKLLGSLFSGGFFHIVGSGFVNTALNFLMGVVLVRILSKADYGAYSFAYNIASFFIIFNGLGAVPAAIQLCSEHFKNKLESDAFFRYAYCIGILVDAAMLVMIIMIALFVPLSISESNQLLLLYCAFPLLTFLCDIKLAFLRIWMKNREYAWSTNVRTALTVMLSIVGALLFQAAGLIVGQSIALLMTWLYMVRRHRFDMGKLFCKKPDELSKQEKKEYWGIASVSALNNGLSQALSMTGIFLVGVLLESDEQVASYVVATAIPFGLLFLPGLLATFAYPYFVRNKNNRSWTLRWYSVYLGASIAAMGIITLLLILMSDWLVPLIFGASYQSSVPAFCVLMIGFFVTASLRQPTGNLLVSQRKLLFNTFVGVVSLIATIVASFMLIPSFGVMGAALSYSVTMLVGALLSVAYYLRTVILLNYD